jgi:hypothetical protein
MKAINRIINPLWCCLSGLIAECALIE